MKSTPNWKQDIFSKDVVDLYKKVIPESDHVREDVLLKAEDFYKLFTVRDGEGTLEAMALICLVTDYVNPLTGNGISDAITGHIDVFALNFPMRKKNLSRLYFETLQSSLENQFRVDSYSVEAYPWNIWFFTKMGLTESMDYTQLWTQHEPQFLYTSNCTQERAKRILEIWQGWQLWSWKDDIKTRYE